VLAVLPPLPEGRRRIQRPRSTWWVRRWDRRAARASPFGQPLRSPLTSQQGLESSGVDLRGLERSSLPFCSAQVTSPPDPSNANKQCGSGADEVEQETANVPIDTISNSDSDKGCCRCEEPNRNNQHPCAGR
jgi:hypothetical protein